MSETGRVGEDRERIAASAALRLLIRFAPFLLHPSYFLLPTFLRGKDIKLDEFVSANGHNPKRMAINSCGIEQLSHQPKAALGKK